MVDQNQDYRSVLTGDDERRLASLRRSEAERPFNLQLIPLDLSTANRGNPFRVGAPFRSIALVTASDPSVAINLAIHTKDESSLNNAVPLRLRDSISFPNDIKDAFLFWDAQAGKTASILLCLDGEFKSGTQISQNAGGISINTGSAFSVSQKTLLAATAGAIFATNANRKAGTFVNDSGASVWIGGATVTNAGATKGIEIPAGATLEWKNTAALYGYSVAGCTLAAMEET